MGLLLLNSQPSRTSVKNICQSTIQPRQVLSQILKTGSKKDRIGYLKCQTDVDLIPGSVTQLDEGQHLNSKDLSFSIGKMEKTTI